MLGGGDSSGGVDRSGMKVVKWLVLVEVVMFGIAGGGIVVAGVAMDSGITGRCWR